MCLSSNSEGANMTKYSIATLRALAITLAVLVPAVASAQEPSTSVALTATQYKLSRLAPPQTSGQAVFAVDDANKVMVLIASNDGALTTSILGPSAQLIDPATITAFGGVYTTIEGGAADSSLLLSGPSAGFQYLYTFPSLGTGNY